MREYINMDDENDTTEQIKSSNLPLVEVNIQNLNLKALIDTGAEVSLINEEIIIKNSNRFHKKLINVSRIKLCNVNGKKFAESRKVLNTKFIVHNKNFEGEFVVVPNINFDIIIGEDILSKLRAKIDLGKRILKLEGSCLPMLGKKLTNDNAQAANNEIENAQAAINIDGEQAKVHMMEKPTYEINNISYRLPKEFTLKCHPDYIDNVQELLLKHKSLVNFEPRIAKGYIHKLNVDETKPFRCKSYPIPFNYRNKVRLELQNMIQADVIESAKTNYINPVVIVKKKNDTIRLCLDARLLNQITKSQFDSPQTADTLISSIGKNTIFSKLDLKNSFWLIPLHPDSRKYTGFSVDGHIFQFKVVPFGLQSASSALVRAMQAILDPYEQFCSHYIDDILIFSETIEKHSQHLKIILEALDTAGLKINLEKCEFYQSKVQYLGFKIGQQGISIGEDRIQEIKDYPRPTNLKTLRGFLGILNYYKKFVPKLSELEVPLIELLRKHVKWEWDERREKAFQKLKQNFHEKLLLTTPDFSLPFILRTDASDHSVAAELTQVQSGIETPIYFISRILKPYEQRYSVSEKEMAAVVYAITKLKFFLTAAHFTLETDHSALCFLMKNRFANNRIYRWSLLIQEFSFDIRHRPGKENITADALTRNRQTDKDALNTYIVALNLLSPTNTLYSEQQILDSQSTLTELVDILNKTPTYKGYSVKNGYIIKTITTQEKYVLGRDLTEIILKDLHKRYGHIGSRKTWLIFRENFYAKNDYEIAKKLIVKCHDCCLGKSKNHTNRNQVHSLVSKNILETIAIDYLSNLIKTKEGYRHIFVITDTFSKFVKAYPTKRCNTRTTLALLTQFCEKYGKPKRILADNATYFNNENFINHWKTQDISVIFTAIRHPKANPAERYVQEILRFLRLATQERHDEWVKHVKDVENFINNVPSTVTQIAPVTVLLGQPPDRPWLGERQVELEQVHNQVRYRIKLNTERYIKRENSKIQKHIQYKQGDLVIIKKLKFSNKKQKLCAKLMYPYEGPFCVHRVINNNTYELKHIGTNLIRGKFNIELIYPYTPNQSNQT